MYLAQLDINKRELFLDLSIYGAISNNKFATEQKNIIDAYCVEMGLPESDYTPVRDLENVLKEIKDTCTTTELNIILIELTALIMGDGIFDTLEQDFMKKIQNAFGVSDEKIEKTFFAIKQLLKSYNMLNEILES